MKAKKWFKIFISLILVIVLALAAMVAIIDPFFHYHAPIKGLYYTLDEERYQNDGITKHFDYDALITGTSMTQNFKTSQAEELFGYDFIKVCYSGGMYKEIGGNIELALETHDVKMVVRGIDGTYLFEDKDASRNDLGTYPTYLYDNNIFNDVNYLLNSTVILGYCLPTLARLFTGHDGGYTSFDDYSSWQAEATFGKEAVVGNGTSYDLTTEQEDMSDDEKKTLIDSFTQNVIDMAIKYPDTDFYLFFPPYSAAYLGIEYEDGQMNKLFQGYKLAASLLVQYDNIHLFAFDDRFDITQNLDNYRDISHYASWVNEEILECMESGTGELTADTYEEYYDTLIEYYDAFDFNAWVNGQ